MIAVIRGMRPKNQVVEVRRMRDGSLRAVNANGRTFVIPADREDAQAFVVYTMIYADELRAVRP